MIIDSHCHAWRYWPYVPEVPDPHSRGTVEQLLFEMDQHGVDQAVVVSARIDHNPDNNGYVAECVRRHPERLHQFADIDCSWTDTYHTPFAAERLTTAVAAYALKGFTHYVSADDDGSWFLSPDGMAFLRAAADLRQIASFAIPARLHPVLRQVAARFPSVPFVCHHMAGARAPEPPPHPVLKEILESAKIPNMYVKMSGFHYVSDSDWNFPYLDCDRVVRALYEHFGPNRLCWGSDYPVVRKSMTYRHALEAFRAYFPFIPDYDKSLILGTTMASLLAEGGIPA